MKRHLSLVSALLVLATPPALALAQPAPLRVRAAIVAADLPVRPIRQLALHIMGARNDTTRLTTHSEGAGEVRLAPGAYRIESVAPFEHGGVAMVWALPVSIDAGVAGPSCPTG